MLNPFSNCFSLITIVILFVKTSHSYKAVCALVVVLEAFKISLNASFAAGGTASFNSLFMSVANSFIIKPLSYFSPKQKRERLIKIFN
jgi:hypothetical protein